MSDIFISYSRQDSEQALHLVERLRSHGLSIWLDQRNIAGAEHWGAEIVEGIHQCSTFLLLVSPASTSSDQVLKELTIASEKRKRILPVELLPTEIPTSFQYALAGLQRVAISDFDGILRAHKHGLERVAVRDTRKSLMVLPFEDLSPASEDNAWFADGLTSELIGTLSCIKSLRLMDQQETKSFKTFKGHLTEYARLMEVRYFVQGSVRKFGDQIKIMTQLLDINTGNYLWQDTYKGMMNDIFEIQEAVAQKVVRGLELHLTLDEQQKLTEWGTENAEAYELRMQAKSYGNLNTKQGFIHAARLAEEAIALDPNYAAAYINLALASIALFTRYSGDSKLLTRAEQAVRSALRLKPNSADAHSTLAHVLQSQGKPEEAICEAQAAIELDPTNSSPYLELGIIYLENRQRDNAIRAFEAALERKPDHLVTHFNLAIQYSKPEEFDRRRMVAERALPYFEKYVRYKPDDQNRRMSYAILLYYADKGEDSRREMEGLLALPGVDGVICYNCAHVYIYLNDYARALELLERSVDLGYGKKEAFMGAPDLKVLQDTETWQRIMQKLEKRSKDNEVNA